MTFTEPHKGTATWEFFSFTENVSEGIRIIAVRMMMRMRNRMQFQIVAVAIAECEAAWLDFYRIFC